MELALGRSFVEPVGEGVALHALLREAVRADLRRRDPLLEADLKRRIADHVYAAPIRGGELGRAIDLSHLIDDPGLRWGFAGRPRRGATWTPRGPGDAAEIDRLLEADPASRWTSPPGAPTRGFFERMPELAAVAKDAAGRIRGFTFVPTTTVEDAELEASPLIGPLLAHARRRTPRGEAVIMPYVSDLTGNPLSGIVGMLANAALLRPRLNPRYTYMTIRERFEAGQAFARLVGGERVPELDRDLPAAAACSAGRSTSARAASSPTSASWSTASSTSSRRRAPEDGYAVRAEQVRDALRNLDSPVGSGPQPAGRGAGATSRSGPARSASGSPRRPSRLRRGSGRAPAARGAAPWLPRPRGQPRGGRRGSSTSPAPPTSAASARRSTGSPTTSPRRAEDGPRVGSRPHAACGPAAPPESFAGPASRSFAGRTCATATAAAEVQPFGFGDRGAPVAGHRVGEVQGHHVVVHPPLPAVPLDVLVRPWQASRSALESIVPSESRSA